MEQSACLIQKHSASRTKCHFADGIFEYIFVYEICCILIDISLQVVTKYIINYKAALPMLA